MTKEQFDNYKFRIKTKIKIRGNWLSVVDIDFFEKRINSFTLEEIEDIKS